MVVIVAQRRAWNGGFDVLSLAGLGLVLHATPHLRAGLSKFRRCAAGLMNASLRGFSSSLQDSVRFNEFPPH